MRNCQLQRLGWAVLAAIIASGVAARAQDDLDDDEHVEANAAGMVFIQQQQPGIEQFEQWVFNRMGGAGVARNRLNAALDLHIDEIRRFCGITDTQRRKLQLAGRGDIKRFFDRVDDAKRRYATAMNDQNHNIWEDIQPLQTALNGGIFGDDSMFAKTVKNTLTSDQSAMLAEQSRRRNEYRYLITVDWFIAHVDKSLGMTASQRGRFANLLKATPPPAAYGSSDYYYLMYRASQIDEVRLRPIFDDLQWRLLSPQLNQVPQMRQWLKNNGMIEDEADVDDKGKRLPLAARRGRSAAAGEKAAEAKVKKREDVKRIKNEGPANNGPPL